MKTAPIVKEIWLMYFTNCLYCFDISLTQELTTWADMSVRLPLAVVLTLQGQGQQQQQQQH